jgi:hypothetical protein
MLPPMRIASDRLTTLRERARTHPLERCGASDRFHDYILEAYEPLSPAEGKLRSVNVLYESFALAGLEGPGRAVVDRVRTELGPFRTVWGIKLRESGELGWELYFYDFERVHADLSISRMREILAPSITMDAREPWPMPWHMFSVEISREHLLDPSRPAAIDVYLDMRSYKVRGAAWELENVYTFHDPRTEIDVILHRLGSSVHFDRRRHNLATLVPLSLLRCHRLCVANKRSADAIYASRIPTRALLDFMARTSWPRELRGFVERYESELDLLLWDVGLDFSGQGGTLWVRKSSLYGSF